MGTGGLFQLIANVKSVEYNNGLDLTDYFIAKHDLNEICAICFECIYIYGKRTKNLRVIVSSSISF